jgi:hypothetical protein
LNDTDQPNLWDNDSGDTQLSTVLPVATLSGIEAPGTQKITRVIQVVEILILVDSGSSYSFISEQVAASVTEVTQSPS